MLASLCLCLSVTTKITAQISQDSSLYDQIEYAFAPLDKSEITTQVLYDKGLTFLDWEQLDGTIDSESMVLESNQFPWLYAQVASSTINDYDRLPYLRSSNNPREETWKPAFDINS